MWSCLILKIFEFLPQGLRHRAWFKERINLFGLFQTSLYYFLLKLHKLSLQLVYFFGMLLHQQIYFLLTFQAFRNKLLLLRFLFV